MEFINVKSIAGPYKTSMLIASKGEIFIECNETSYKLADILHRINEPLSSIFNIGD